MGRGATRRRAFAIADRAMFEVLRTETVAIDDFECTLAITNAEGQPVHSIELASAELREAVAWLQQRHYIQLSSDGLGQYIDVNRRPGEH